MDIKNVLLVIVDCLRYDYVTEEHMPFLFQWGREHTWFSNHWATSHCTDPSITHILSGKHPDALRLYSMMFDEREYTIPGDVEMLPQLAKKHGYHTGFVTNLGRWYRRGVDRFVNSRGESGGRIFGQAMTNILSMQAPWFMIVHTDDMHTVYTGGSYQRAAKAVDRYIQALLGVVDEYNTSIFITSDHGEGLGQKGLDGNAVEQHGYGLWDFLTHVPLLISSGQTINGARMGLSSHGMLYRRLRSHIDLDYSPEFVRGPVFQAGAIPECLHRGVVLPDGRQFIRETTEEGHRYFYAGDFTDEKKIEVEIALKNHCAGYGIEYGDINEELRVMRRLRGLGYWGG